MATTMRRNITKATLGESFARVIFDEIRTAAAAPIVPTPDTDTGETGTTGAAGVTGATATFADSGVQATADPDTPLLAVAETAGLAPRFGCRRGVCRRCAVDLTCGAVRNVHDGTRTDTPDTRVKICVNAADGDVTLPI